MRLSIPEAVSSEERERFLYWIVQYYQNVGSDTVPLDWEAYSPEDMRRKLICVTLREGEFVAPRTFHPFAEVRSEGEGGAPLCEFFYVDENDLINSTDEVR